MFAIDGIIFKYYHLFQNDSLKALGFSTNMQKSCGKIAALEINVHGYYKLG